MNEIDTSLRNKVVALLCDSTTLHKPLAVGSGACIQFFWDNGNYISQLFIEIDSGNRVFKRYYNGSSWMSWVSV